MTHRTARRAGTDEWSTPDIVADIDAALADATPENWHRKYFNALDSFHWRNWQAESKPNTARGVK